MELCSDKLRKPVGAFYFIGYAMGYTALGGMAYILRDWRWLHVACSAPMLILPFYHWLVIINIVFILCYGIPHCAISLLKFQFNTF